MNPFESKVSIELLDHIRAGLSRREFLIQSLLMGASVVASPSLKASQLPAHADISVLKEEPWQSFSMVQLHLFPQDGEGPGALDIHALQYLYHALKQEDDQTRRFMLKGVDWLNDAAVKTTEKAFIKNAQQQREQILHLIAQSEVGENWLAYLMTYIVEALLTDPVYGGNPDGVGWRWLQHQPGYPRPPRHKRYWELR